MFIPSYKKPDSGGEVGPSIYGVEWDGTSTTKWTRTDDAVGMSDPDPYYNQHMGFSDFDYVRPWSDIKRVTDSEAGELVEIPKFWYNLTQLDGGGIKIQIADGEVEGFHVSPAHMNRGINFGECDVVYVGRYHCNTLYQYKSIGTSYITSGNQTRAYTRSSIHNLGSTIWQWDFAMRFTIQLLYLVEFADWDSQAKIGYGCGNGSSIQMMAYTDSMPYHTGTTQSSRTTYGLGTQYRYIEGLWDNLYDWLDGCYYNSSGLNIISRPVDFNDEVGGTLVGLLTNGFPSAFTVKNIDGSFPMFIPTTSNGSNTTYSCDFWGFDGSYPCLFAGGNYYQGLSSGLFYTHRNTASGKNANCGSRLMKLPSNS